MNRNDASIPSSSSSLPGLPSEGYPRPTAAVLSSRDASSPRRSVASRTFQPRSAGSLGGGKPSFPKNALLEEQSVHLPMPSFHDRNRSAPGWACAGCQSINQSALSNECSVCGMLRSVDWTENDEVSESMAGDGSFSEFSELPFDGNGSEASLNFNTLGNIDAIEEGPTRVAPRGHASLPPNAFHNSMTSYSSLRSTRTNAFPRRSTTILRGGVAEIPDDSSVLSFRDWNGNAKVKPWECRACTFINENPLHIACEMCGTRRERVPGTTAEESLEVASSSPPVETPPVAVSTAATAPAPSVASAPAVALDHSSTEEGEEDHELALLREEQIRELISVQREIMAGFGAAHVSSSNSAALASDTASLGEDSKFSTLEMQHEVNQMQANLVPRLDYNDVDNTDLEQERLKDIVRAQQEIMLDFKRKRGDESDDNPKKYSVSPARSVRSTISAKNFRGVDSLFGGTNEPNTTPNHLRESMRAAGGRLRQEDLCLPILWGDDLGKASSGKVASK